MGEKREKIRNKIGKGKKGIQENQKTEIENENETDTQKGEEK